MSNQLHTCDFEWQLACIDVAAMPHGKSVAAAKTVDICPQAASATAQGPEFGRRTYTLCWPGQVYDPSIAREVAVRTDVSAAVKEAPAVPI